MATVKNSLDKYYLWKQIIESLNGNLTSQLSEKLMGHTISWKKLTVIFRLTADSPGIKS